MLMEKYENLIKTYNEKVDLGESLSFKVIEAEKIYRMELSKFLAEQIMEGKKVSVLGDIARGHERVAPLRYEKQKQEALLEANKNRIFALHKEIQLTELQLKLEYGNIH